LHTSITNSKDENVMLCIWMIGVKLLVKGKFS